MYCSVILLSLLNINHAAYYLPGVTPRSFAKDETV